MLAFRQWICQKLSGPQRFGSCELAKMGRTWPRRTSDGFPMELPKWRHRYEIGTGFWQLHKFCFQWCSLPNKGLVGILLLLLVLTCGISCGCVCAIQAAMCCLFTISMSRGIPVDQSTFGRVLICLGLVLSSPNIQATPALSNYPNHQP